MNKKKVLIAVIGVVVLYFFYTWAYNRGLAQGVKATIGK